MNKFLAPDNKLLYKKAKAIKKQDFQQKWVLDILKEMREIAGVNQNHKTKNKAIMLGLAAPQIGYPYKIVFVDLSATPSRDGVKKANNLFLINPKITSFNDTKIKNREGCYSAMTDTFRVSGILERSDAVTVEYQDEFGKKQTQEFKGFTAVIVQHEVDHLNGKVFVHHIEDEKNLHLVFTSEVDAYKQNYKKWKRTLKPETYFKDVCKIYPY